jgi:class 3 adenylate cyclase
MSFRPGWDSLDRRTLRFREPDVETAYRAHVLETRRRRQRMATLGGTAIFAGLAIITPVLTDIPAWPASGALALLAANNLLTALLVGRSRTVRQLDAAGIGIQLSSGLILLVLFVITDTFTRFGAPALMSTAVFAFGVSRHPFRNAVVISTGQTVSYLAFGVGLGLAPGILVDTFILAATLGAACAGTYVAERAERRLFAQDRVVADLHRRVDELLHRYLAPEVADTFIADPSRAELGGEEVEITVLFADLSGFTSFSERVRPDEAMAMLNAALGAAVPAVLGQGGTVVQFAGDALVAIFNAPVRQADHALRAARAALGLQGAAAAAQPDPAMPRFRVGLNTGPALVGNVGSAELRSFTAIGDTTNLAARLQTFAAPGMVVIGERTAALLGDGADLRPLGAPHLKGKALPVEVYELHALRADTDALRR